MPVRRRLAIAVAPRLLGDTLGRVLARADRVVVVVAPGGADEGGGGGADADPFDIALVTSGEPDPPASVVIRLPDSPPLGVARVGGRSVPLDDLESLVALVERCAAELEAAPPVDNSA